MNGEESQTDHHHPESAPVPFEFVLYISGDSDLNQITVCNLKNLCAQHLHGQYLLTIVDVDRHPEQAEEHNILATPTLIQLRPEPARRILGDLSNRGRLLGGLGLIHHGNASS